VLIAVVFINLFFVLRPGTIKSKPMGTKWSTCPPDPSDKAPERVNIW
jgi:hypothetical protein